MKSRSQGYPDAWLELCRIARARKRVSATEAFKLWNTAAARYRAAKLFDGILMQPPATPRIARGYHAGIKLLLSYAAYESAKNAAKVSSIVPHARRPTATRDAASNALRALFREQPRCVVVLRGPQIRATL